ncbi:MAG: efflux RND transporter periplasmic adaptor subunit [Candidatus Acidiferrales bacterium]
MADTGKRKKWIWLVVAAVIIAAIILIGLSGRGQGPRVTIVTVGREDLRVSISSNGKVEPIAPLVARATYPTFVSSVKATEGQLVHSGQLILTLDSADIRSQLAQARAGLLAAQTDLRNARAGGPPVELTQLKGDIEKATVQVANLERTQKSLNQLVTQQAATQDEVAQNQAALAQARANLQTLQQKKDQLAAQSSTDADGAALRVQQAQAQVQGLEEKLRSATVVSSLDGTLYSLPVEQGAYVQVGDVLAEMADLHHVRVRAFIDEPDLGSLAPGQLVQLTWDGRPGETWSGRTEQVPKQVVPRGNRSVGEVICSVDNSKLELLPNINVGVRILVADRPGAVVVPRAGVSEDHGQHYVFVYTSFKIHRQDITIGAASDVKYEVLSGLKDGDRIALPGDNRLRDGMDVRPTEAQ